MSSNARRTGPAIEAHYQFLPWLIPAADKFPRSQKFMPGDRIQAAALDVQEAHPRGRSKVAFVRRFGSVCMFKQPKDQSS